MTPLCGISPGPRPGTAVFSCKHLAYNKNHRQEEGMLRSRGSASSGSNPFSQEGRDPTT